jgi:C2H2-type zinc finger protein
MSGMAGGLFKCAECGRTFERAPALGAHRRRAHGIAGTARRRTVDTSRPRFKDVDRDALLGALFPQGVPARAELLVAVSAWLDEADRLAATAAVS